MVDTLKYDIPRSEVVPFVPAAAKTLLDVGCGSGQFGAELHRDRPGLELWAVEPDHAMADAARDVFGRVIEATFDDALPELPEGHFDVVSFTDVLEHLIEPADAVVATRRLLSPDGVVVAAIPNIRHLSVTWPLVRRGAWPYEENGLLDRTHLRFFTRQTMIELFTDNGYNVRSVDGVNLTTNWRYAGPGRKLRALRRVAGERLDEFFCVQYVLIAAPV
jgi:2-polyprenyl-3-methyl-5-hydroxy-6-metoxy-1,4-benzoquinol methylase